MAISFFISVRLLGEADSNIVSISVFALAISILGVVDDFLNLNWKLKIIFQFLFVGLPIYLLNQTINFGQDRKLILIKYIVLTVTQQIKHAD